MTCGLPAQDIRDDQKFDCWDCALW